MVSEDEIRAIIEVGEESGVVAAEQRRMLHGIFDLSETRVRDVMIPRTEALVLDSTTPTTEALASVIRRGHSRVPVYHDSIDKVVGILYVKDLLRAVAKGGVDEDPIELSCTGTDLIHHLPSLVARDVMVAGETVGEGHERCDGLTDRDRKSRPESPVPFTGCDELFVEGVILRHEAVLAKHDDHRVDPEQEERDRPDDQDPAIPRRECGEDPSQQEEHAATDGGDHEHRRCLRVAAEGIHGRCIDGSRPWPEGALSKYRAD